MFNPGCLAPFRVQIGSVKSGYGNQDSRLIGQLCNLVHFATLDPLTNKNSTSQGYACCYCVRCQHRTGVGPVTGANTCKTRGQEAAQA